MLIDRAQVVRALSGPPADGSLPPSLAFVDALQAMAQRGGPGFLLPASNGELLRWSLARGLRFVQVMTLMTRGLYQTPRGAYLPSILC
jgi:hypothetical protein